jgi:hypothetical protein
MGNQYRPSVFVLHSKGVSSHRALVESLKKVANEMSIPLTDYAHWSWETEDGKSDAELRQERDRLLRGDRYFKETGWIEIRGAAPVELELLTGGRFNPRYPAQSLNDKDLERLLCAADVLLFVEDDEQPKLTAGILHEIEILRQDSDSRRRLARRIRATIASQESQATLYGPEVVQPPIELTIGIQKDRNGDLDNLDVELTALSIVLLCADRSLLSYLQPERRDYWVGIPIHCEPGSYYISQPDAYIESVVDKIVQGTNTRAQLTLLSIIDALWSESMYRSMCQQVTTCCERRGATSQAREALHNFINSHPAGMWKDVKR